MVIRYDGRLGARARLDLVDDEEAGEHGTAVQHDELAVAHVHGVVVRGAVPERLRVVALRRPDAPGDDAAHQHGPANRAGRRRGSGVRGAAAGEGAHRGAGRAELAGGDASTEDAAHARARGRAALEAHHLVAVGAAPGRGAVRARRRPGLLEPCHSPRAAVHAEHRLHLRSRRGGAGQVPAGREDELHHLPRRVALRQLRHGQERRARGRGRGPGRRHERGRRLLGLLLGPRPRRLLLPLLPVPPPLPARLPRLPRGRHRVPDVRRGAARRREERLGLLARGRRDDGVRHAVGPAAEGPHPCRRHRDGQEQSARSREPAAAERSRGSLGEWNGWWWPGRG
uniref:Uncharacterized protein n=1 Tax=Triticum urartu TaxID=4572 RepID=A0A8R7P4S2_TRIUA